MNVRSSSPMLSIAVRSLLSLTLLAACAGARSVTEASSLGARPFIAMVEHRPNPVADSGLSLKLNLPAFRLEVRRGGELVRVYGVAVGMRKYPTPRGDFSVTHIEWNPWWIPPDQPWARRERVTPPGPENPMGKVKLYFRPLYFLHGTPAASSIGSAASHGCVRMRNEDAVDLALMLHAADGSAVVAETLDSLIQNRTPTRVIDLARPVPLAITYQLADVRSDSLFLYPDIYGLLGGGHVENALLALRQAGLDTTAVRMTVLAKAARDARRSAVALSIESVITPGRASPD